MARQALEIEAAKVPSRARFFAGAVPSGERGPRAVRDPGPEYVAFSGLLREVLASAAAAGCSWSPAV